MAPKVVATAKQREDILTSMNQKIHDMAVFIEFLAGSGLAIYFHVVSDVNSSFDFAVYDDRAVTSVFAQTGEYFGRKTVKPEEIAKYLHLYEWLEHSAHPVILENDRVVLAGTALAPSPDCAAS